MIFEKNSTKEQIIKKIMKELYPLETAIMIMEKRIDTKRITVDNLYFIFIWTPRNRLEYIKITNAEKEMKPYSSRESILYKVYNNFVSISSLRRQIKKMRTEKKPFYDGKYPKFLFDAYNSGLLTKLLIAISEKI